MRIVKISTKEQSELYAEHFNKIAKCNLPSNVFKNSDTLMIEKCGKPIGGMCVISDINHFRVLRQIPYTVKLPAKINEFAEITGFWFSSKSALVFSMFFIILLRLVLFSRKKYFIYSYGHSNFKLREYYSVGCPIRIYSGVMSTGACENVECLGKVGLLAICFRGIFAKIGT